MWRFSVVCCVNRPEVARRHLLASPCMRPGSAHQLVLVHGASSAGAGMSAGLAVARHEWLLMVHQDVHLPDGWDVVFSSALDRALAAHPTAAVVGVYGVQADGTHVGHVFDRDRWLGQPVTAAVPVRSLDELLLAVRVGSGVCASPQLGWHLYGTDVCLAAQARGLQSLVVTGPCEHWSLLPRVDERADRVARQALREVAQAYGRSAEVLLQRWPQAAPIHTPVMPLPADFSSADLMAWVDQP